MKIKICTRIPIKQAWLDEVKLCIPDAVFIIEKTTQQLSVTYKPEQQSMYCDFSSLRNIVNDTTVNVRAFYMPYSELRALGVTNHLALYDNSDRDGIFDFYVGLQDKLDARAYGNGFKSNFAWEFIHETTHGEEQNIGNEYMATNGDRTHAMEAQGRLKDLFIEDRVTIPALIEKKNILIRIIESIIQNFQKQIMNKCTLPVQDFENISQQFLTPNKEYKSGVHNGTDWAVPPYTKVYAPFNGYISEVFKKHPTMGNCCYFHFTYQDKAYSMRVMHLAEVPIVRTYLQGEILGYSGNTGQSSGPHVHIDLWRGNSIDPKKIMTKEGVIENLIDPYQFFKSIIT